ncbi:hypothetical protein SAM19_01033 [Brevibacillus laterosporus]|nr:hypothetical protein [Brevibacillus laterosporus]
MTLGISLASRYPIKHSRLLRWIKQSVYASYNQKRGFPCIGEPRLF